MSQSTPETVERPANPPSARLTSYAVGDRVEVIKPTTWKSRTGTVRWCNNQWMSVRLDNKKAILSLHVSDVNLHNDQAHARREQPKT